MSTDSNLFAAVIPAAGSGKRFGVGDKLLVEVGGRSVLQRSVGLFAGRGDVGEVVIVTSVDRFAAYREHLKGIVEGERLVLVEGGAERYHSVYKGLKAVGEGMGFVAIHDAARPLTSQGVIDAAFAGAVAVGGSLPVVAEPATLKRVGADGKVSATVERAGLFQAQTPQCFGRVEIIRCYEKLMGEGRLEGITDDAQVFERCGLSVLATAGEVSNLKITTGGDVGLAEAILRGSSEL